MNIKQKYELQRKSTWRIITPETNRIIANVSLENLIIMLKEEGWELELIEVEDIIYGEKNTPTFLGNIIDHLEMSGWL